MRELKYRLLWKFGPLAIGLLLGLSCSDKGTEPAINNAPRITSASAVEAILDSLFTYTATATDPDGDELDIGFENYPDWLTVAGAVISGTPEIQVADEAFTVIATDGFLSDTLSVLMDIVLAPSLISYSSDIQPIFNNNCAGSNCHVGGMANGLSLESYTSLMNGGNSGAVVLPGNPDGSIIVRRLEGNIQPQMPLGRSPLPTPQIQLIRDWIAEGAHDN
ncbi:MAG: c-type cytochrome domain-containing protein [candidate division Zixibacteria bacterium]